MKWLALVSGLTACACAVGMFLIGVSSGYDRAIAEVTSGESIAWYVQCYEKEKRQAAEEEKRHAAQALAGVEVSVTPEIQKVIDKCLEAGGTVDGVGGNGVICMMPY